MASPPYSNTASSPPGPSPLSLPRQRPHNGLSLPTKHRKLSSTSNSYPTSAHPLRQTSFPPSEGYEREAFSPADSLDSLDDADIRSAVGEESSTTKKRKRGEKRPRGRPPKDARAHAARKAGSVNGSESTSKRAGTAGATSVLTHSDEEDEDEEGGGDGDADGGTGRAAGDFSLLPAEMDRDKQRKFLFREAVPPAHQSRYDSFNTVKLKASEVRKLVNSTLSQSVPANVVTVVGSYTKMFAGMLIEAAREAQAERLAVREKRPDGEENAAYRRLMGMEEPPEVEWESESEDDPEGEGEEKNEEKKSPSQDVQQSQNGEDVPKDQEIQPDKLPDGDPNSADEKEAEETTAVAALPNRTSNHQSPKPKRKVKKPKLSHPDPLNTDLPEHDFSTIEPGAWGLGKFVEDCDRGPLQPDDLREALRRYKRSRAGGSVGFTGISLEGREGVASRMGGRRLFR